MNDIIVLIMNYFSAVTDEGDYEAKYLKTSRCGELCVNCVVLISWMIEFANHVLMMNGEARVQLVFGHLQCHEL